MSSATWAGGLQLLIATKLAALQEDFLMSGNPNADKSKMARKDTLNKNTIDLNVPRDCLLKLC